ncbi:MAG: NAD(+)/NADH kinase [Gemmatimonadaceae bacterium]|nr:NAD(+)/NADH kinase [Gemmatimonadaceae bacterium]
MPPAPAGDCVGGRVKVTVIHNPSAGEGSTARRDLRRLLKAAGHEVVYRSTKAKGWKQGIRDAEDLVLAVGGDGTVAKVARRLAGRPVPLAMIPTGVGNNIARALSHDLAIERDEARVVDSLPSRTPEPFDLGVVSGGPPLDHFSEAVGVGLIPELIAESQHRRKVEEVAHGEELQHSIDLAVELLEGMQPQRCRLIADGDDLSGDYLLVEVMNIRSAGPRIDFAPGADPHDGMLDVVALPASSRDAAITAIRRGRPFDERVPAVRRLAREVELEWTAGHLHIDDSLWPDDADSPCKATLGVDAGALLVLR